LLPVDVENQRRSDCNRSDNTPPVEMHPFTEEQLEEVWSEARARNRRLADVLLVAAWTGLRWSELRAIRVRDFVEVPLPLLIVQRAAPEGVGLKVTRSGKVGE
jgi:integrase